MVYICNASQSSVFLLSLYNLRGEFNKYEMLLLFGKTDKKERIRRLSEILTCEITACVPLKFTICVPHFCVAFKMVFAKSD